MPLTEVPDVRLTSGGLMDDEQRQEQTVSTPRYSQYDKLTNTVTFMTSHDSPTPSLDVEHALRALAQQVCDKYPDIDMNVSIKGGIPRIKGSRLAVAQVLGRVYALGSIDAVVEYYSPSISRVQVQQAIAFAKDFVEATGEPFQIAR